MSRAPAKRRRALPRRPEPPRRRVLVGWIALCVAAVGVPIAAGLIARDRVSTASCIALWTAAAASWAVTWWALPVSRLRSSFGLVLPLMLVYLATPSRPQSFDTHPTRYLAVSLAERHDFDLDEWPEQLSLMRPAYWVHRHDGHLYSAYPPGAAFFAAPLWPLFRAAGFDSRAAPVVALARTAAALSVALAAAVLHAALRRHGLDRAAGWATFAFALASGNLALASQDLWQHGPAQLGLAIALYGLAGRERRDVFLVGFGFGLATLMRPVLASVAAAGAAVWLLGHRDARSWATFAAGAVPPPLLALISNLAVFGTVVGGYSEELRESVWEGNPLVALLGLWASPSRGLLVFSPWLLLGVPGLVLVMRRDRGIGLLLAATLAVFLAVMSFRVNWWAGHCYGPRYPLDVLPFLTFPAALAADAWLRRAPRVAASALAALTLVGLLMQLPALLGEEGRRWSGEPNVDRFPSRIWDWSDSQWLAGWREVLGVPQRVYRVGRLPHAVGEVASDARFPDEPFVRCAPSGEHGRGYLSLGPGHRWAAGRWRARFRLAVDQPLHPGSCAERDPAAVLDVVTEGGIPAWARREVSSCSTHGPVDIDVPFELHQSQPLELRIETSGTARICASTIEVTHPPTAN